MSVDSPAPAASNASMSLTLIKEWNLENLAAVEEVMAGGKLRALDFHALVRLRGRHQAMDRWLKARLDDQARRAAHALAAQGKAEPQR